MRVVADTNVVVRFLVADDEAQFRRVRARAERVRRAGGKILVPTLVFAEASRVLSSAYGYERGEIVEALAALAATRPWTPEDRPLLENALALARRGPAGLADYLVLACARRASATLLTFDRKLTKEPDAELP